MSSEIDGSFDLVNEDAVVWAKEHAAKHVSQDGNGNPISESTRIVAREAIVKAIGEGWDPNKLAGVLRENCAFEREHALTMALTEVARAQCQGSLKGYIASGVVSRKRWLAAENDCGVCKANAAQGEIALMEPFLSGDLVPPAHDRCRCDFAPCID